MLITMYKILRWAYSLIMRKYDDPDYLWVYVCGVLYGRLFESLVLLFFVLADRFLVRNAYVYG